MQAAKTPAKTPGGAWLSDPQGVAVDADGDVFIADKSDNVVREINAATGLIHAVASSGTIIPGLSGPTGLALDANGDLFVADSGNGVVWEITGVNGADPQANVVAGGGTDSSLGYAGAASGAALNDPTGLAVDAAGDLLYVADSGNDAIREVTGIGSGNPQIGTLVGSGATEIPGTSAGYSYTPKVFAPLNDPTGLALDANGDLFIADTGNGVVREVRLGTGHQRVRRRHGRHANQPGGPGGQRERKSVHRRDGRQHRPRGECRHA